MPGGEGWKGGLVTHIVVYCHKPGEQDRLCGLLRAWTELSCVALDVFPAQAAPPGPAIIFWDLDGPELPPVREGENGALFLLSGDPQRAIGSYSFHPTGFLTKPASMDMVWNAMLRCAQLWFDCLLRLEVFSERVKIGVPFKNVIWVEGTRRGCVVHTTNQSVSAREPLYRLEERLPETVFTRCQRSFVVNLTHVREIAGNSLFLSDGTEISLGRGIKAGVLEAYQRYRALRYGE